MSKIVIYIFALSVALTLSTGSTYNAHQPHITYPTQNEYQRPPPSRRKQPNGGSGRFEEVYRWKQMSFAPLDNDSIIFGPTDKRLNDLTASEIQDNFIQYNNLPMGVLHHRDRLFITLPRRRVGMPATITYVRTSGAPGSSPPLQAFPNFRTNELHPQGQRDSNRIVSVYRSHVDECNRLWFVDTGSLEYPGNTIQVQPPSIWIFDLETDQLIRRFEIPTNLIVDGHGIASITVDIDNRRCDDAFGYLPDLANYRLHVYSFRQNQMWTFSHNYLSFDPLRGDFGVAGVQFQWNDGIFSITLSNRNPDGFKTAFFHAMASTSEFMVSTQVLRNQSMATRSYHGSDFKYLGQRSESGQSAMHVYDKETGIIFYSQVSLNAVGCWNTALPLTESNLHLIAQDNSTMIYPSDINIDSDGVIWMMTNSLPLYNYASVDPNEFNYRIWKAPVREAIAGTQCANTLSTNNPKHN